MKPALGSGASPDWGEREGEAVGLHQRDWGDARDSFIYTDGYATAEPDGRNETPPLSGVAHGMLKAPVWTWEVPLYFWAGGIASGAAFVALACDLSGDRRSARIARLVSCGALLPCPPLLMLDLGRPARFYNMLRVFKPRSPMSMGAWALTLFGNLIGAAVGADLLGKEKTARALGAATAVTGGYLGSYTGVLLASTAVPVWARSRLFLGPIFVCTATATGAAAVRLALDGLDPEHPTRRALGQVQAGAMVAELVLSEVNERKLGKHAAHGRKFTLAKWLVRAGLATQAIRKRSRIPSLLYLAAGLLFRYAWVEAGPASARDDHSVAEMARTPV